MTTSFKLFWIENLFYYKSEYCVFKL